MSDILSNSVKTPKKRSWSKGSRIRTGIFCAFLLASVGLFSGCLMESGGSSASGEKGHVQFDLRWSRPETSLMKHASADTTFSLDSVILVFSAPGAATQTYSYPFSGRADLGDLYGESPVYDLAPLRNWKVKILSIDTSMNPARRDTVHFDSLTFSVYAGSVTTVNGTISPVYSILRARFLSTSGDSLGAGVRFLRLRVNGVTRDSIALASGSGNANTAVFFPSITTGWLSNDAGALMKSTDSGNTWTTQTNPAGVKMNALWFNSTSQGWAVGEGGAIVKSNGTSWSSQSSGINSRLNGVMFVSSNKGYAVGDSGRVLKTTDGGSTWGLISGGWYPLDGGISTTVNSLSFADAGTGWAVGDNGVIRRTTNGGLDWGEQTSGVTTPLRGVYAISSSIVVAVGENGVIRRTTNGGTSTWSSISSGITSSLLDVHFASSSYGWAVGEGGTIRRSANGGASFGSQTSGVSTRLTGVASNFSNRVLVVGDNGVVRRLGSINGTGSFGDASNSATSGMQLNGVYMLPNSNTAWIVGNNGFIAKSTNTSNNNWATQTSGTNQNLLKVRFADANIGWVTGVNGVILKTTDGGTNWVSQSSGTTASLMGLDVVDPDSAYIAGASGVFLKTRGGGSAVTLKNLNGVYFDGDTGYVVGDGGTALRTANGGATWSAITGSTKNLYATFISPSGNNVYAVGAQGEYLTTSNATFSSSWDVRNSGTSQTLRAVWVSASDPGPASIYVSGDNGVIRVRNDGSLGDLNLGVSTGTTETLWGLQCLGVTNNCWAVGGDETVLRTTTAAVNGWTTKSSGGVRIFDKLLTFKYLKPGQANTVVIQAIDRESPLRGYQSTVNLTLGAGIDSTITAGMTRCGYGGPACSF